jgi:uncharacterized protein YndB with AHSA1/START domain
MAPIVESVEISRRPEDVFPYATDPRKISEWQENVVKTELEGSAPVTVGSKIKHTRRLGRTERDMTIEITELSPPRRWALRGIDGPIRPVATGTVEPLEDGERSRVTIELDFEGHGIGKLLVPLVVRPQAKRELPRNQQRLKERLESGAA